MTLIGDALSAHSLCHDRNLQRLVRHLTFSSRDTTVYVQARIAGPPENADRKSLGSSLGNQPLGKHRGELASCVGRMHPRATVAAVNQACSMKQAAGWTTGMSPQCVHFQIRHWHLQPLHLYSFRWRHLRDGLTAGFLLPHFNSVWVSMRVFSSACNATAV